MAARVKQSRSSAAASRPETNRPTAPAARSPRSPNRVQRTSDRMLPPSSPGRGKRLKPERNQFTSANRQNPSSAAAAPAAIPAAGPADRTVKLPRRRRNLRIAREYFRAESTQFKPLDPAAAASHDREVSRLMNCRCTEQAADVLTRKRTRCRQCEEPETDRHPAPRRIHQTHPCAPQSGSAFFP